MKKERNREIVPCFSLFYFRKDKYMSKKFRIVTLNEKFYNKYKSNEYPELL